MIGNAMNPEPKCVKCSGEMDRGFIVRRRHQNAAPWIDLQPEHGWRVEVVIEDERFVLFVMALEILDEAWRPWALALQPIHFIGSCMRILKDPF